ncbi:integrase core domain protein [Daphnia sinensis]|uniref:RNA-directed DNA polymerase n=1 Tax=Daphnia sinensis TaxID=1820382 RepID=A0AAD5L8A3_9CRUS|nr:integrase core domain protein [Daphnia sinensis]
MNRQPERVSKRLRGLDASPVRPLGGKRITGEASKDNVHGEAGVAEFGSAGTESENPGKSDGGKECCGYRLSKIRDSGFGEQSGLQVATEGESQEGSEVEEEEVVERRESDASLAWDHGDGIRRVEYFGEAPSSTSSEVELQQEAGLLGEEEHGARDGASEKIIIREGRNLPPRSLVAVEIEPLSPVLACSVLIEPSTSLEKAKEISAGRILIKREEGVVRVLMLNPGNRSQYVGPGTVIGNTVEIEGEVPLSKEDKVKTAFITADGLYQFLVMPMGLCSAPGTFQRMMDLVLAGLRWTSCLVYLDDVIVYANNIEQHLERLRMVLAALQKANLKIKTSKCIYGETELVALGHLIGANLTREKSVFHSRFRVGKGIGEAATFNLITQGGDREVLIEQQRSEWGYVFEKLDQGEPLENYTVKDGALFRAFRKSILLACHDDMMAGHLGEARTWERVKQRYYWIGRKAIRSSGNGYFGAFPKDDSRNRYIVVAVDYVTKWAEVGALGTAGAKEVAKFFVSEIVLRHGAPRNLTTDQGMCFMAEMMKRVTDALETNHRPTTAYHPQANGQVERLNHTLADMLSMYVSGDHSDWDVALEYVRFAYNTSRHETTGRTPFFLMHVREAVMPIDVTLGGGLPNEEGEGGEVDSYEIRMQRGLKKAFAAVEGHTQRAQERYKAYYDSRRREAVRYAVGEKVLVYKPVRKIGRAEKLLHRWHGPYEAEAEEQQEEAVKPEETANQELEEENQAIGEEQSEGGTEEGGAKEIEEENNNPSREEESGRRAEGERVFTDSEWVLVTDITFGQTDAVASDLEKWLKQKSSMADDSKPSEIGRFHSTLIAHVHARALDGLLWLQIITRSYEGLKATVCAPRRPRRQRGLMDGGGTVLNWLFGVATTDDLVKVNKNIEQLSTESTAIVHALEVHTAQIISKLQGSCDALDREMRKAEFRLSNVLKETEHQRVAMGKVEETFRGVGKCSDGTVAISIISTSPIRASIGGGKGEFTTRMVTRSSVAHGGYVEGLSECEGGGGGSGGGKHLLIGCTCRLFICYN